MAELLRDDSALEAYLWNQSIPFTRARDGVFRLPIRMMEGVAGVAELRWSREPATFGCVTRLPIPVPPERREAVAGAVAAVNRNLPDSRFVASEGVIFHIAGGRPNADGSLSSSAVDIAVASTRSACDRHFRDLLRAVVVGHEPRRASAPGPASPPPFRFNLDQLASLRLQAAAVKSTLLHRLGGPLVVEELDNPWFEKTRILFAQSLTPMPAIGVTVALRPDGRVRILGGQVTALNELVRAEGVALLDDDAARAYANVVTSWTTAADFPEMPVGTFEEIPFRPGLPAAVRARIESLRAELRGRIAPLSFVRTDAGWRLDVWLVSVSRLVRRTALVEADGTLDVSDEIVEPYLPVPPGAAWGKVGDRHVPVG